MGEDKSALSTEVHIICGPPGSGKTTFVQKHMQPGDLILDMDAIVAALTGNKSTHPDYSNVMNTALAVRETIYKSIESGKAGKRAFVITATSDKQQVENLSRRLHGSMHYMDTPEAECIKRICNDPTRPDKEKDRALVKRWFSVSKSTEKGIPMNETVNQETNGTAAAQQENRTFTQDEVNAIVADRLTRERAKYADYDDLKGKAGRADEADSRAAALQQQLDAMKADNDRREMKQRVSAATGVPAALLTGDTEESCTEQAHEIMQFAAPSYQAIPDGGTAGAVGNYQDVFSPASDNALSNAFCRDNKDKEKDNISSSTATAENDISACVQAYEQNIGPIARAAFDDISRQLADLPADLICEAIGEAALNNKRSWNYVKAILKRCREQNILSVDAYRAEKENHAAAAAARAAPAARPQSKQAAVRERLKKRLEEMGGAQGDEPADNRIYVEATELVAEPLQGE